MMKQIRWLLANTVMVVTILAGCRQTTEPQHVTFTDDQLTAIANTAQASVQQTALASSPTPPPPTSTPQVSLISGTSLEKHDDGTYIFIDHKAGIRLVTPAGWLPVRVNEDEYYKAFTLEAVSSNQTIIDRLTQIQSNNTDFFRLDVIDIRPGHTVNGAVSVVSVVFQEFDTRTLAEWLKAERNRKSPFTGFKFIGSKYEETTNGYRVLVIEESWDSAYSGTIYYQGVFFSLPTGTYVLDFFSDFDFKDTILPDFDQMINSLGPINP
jgi:hypothetical protein